MGRALLCLACCSAQVQLSGALAVTSQLCPSKGEVPGLLFQDFLQREEVISYAQ